MRAHIPIVMLMLLVTPAVVPGLTAATANAEVITVCWDGSGDYLTIQEGIDAALDGDEVVVCDGVYTGPGNKNLDFAGKAITVRSENGPENCVIDCENDGRGFYFHSGETTVSVVDGFTITNGNELHGGAVYCEDSSPMISHCTIAGNVALSEGGGICCYGGSPTITNCSITGNAAIHRGGAVLSHDSDPTIGDCVIGENAANAGGGVYCQGGSSATITNCTVTGNSASSEGGGIYCELGTLTISDCTIAENSGANYGGGALCRESDTTISSCAITGNTAGYGGGVYCEATSNATISKCTIMQNTAQAGGGVHCYECCPTIVDCAISENVVWHHGGGIFLSYSDPAITHCTISGNTAHRGGAGVFCHRASPTINSCALAANIATYAGAVCCLRGSPVITNCLITGNAAKWGGALECYCSDLTVTDCTLAANLAVNGRALACDSHHSGCSSIQMANCILWDGGNEIWNNDDSTITITYSDVQAGWSGQGNIDADPLFVDAEHEDYRLLPCSPCVDAGDNDAVPADEWDLDDDGDTDEPIPFDVDGNPRFVDDPYMPDTGHGDPPIVDMGAYEFQADCPGDVDGDRDVDEFDLGILLAAWHVSDGGDLNCDELTDHADLGILLTHWGEECP
ncbi:MAG TPA: right-handed parallel beta-helix repeat-containing protein [Phycisphaerae bacterium]|nr:right-handed parallel beta-helix repeat-containing protein [Phycisphaerae bacterium]